MTDTDNQAITLLATAPYVDNNTIINEVAVDDKEKRLAARSNIDSFEVALQALAGSETGNQEEINSDGLSENFCDGMYSRSLNIPKDTAMVSKIWKRDRLWHIVSGEVTFTTEMGTQHIKAPFFKVVPAGSKVALYTHEDTLWYATVATNKTNSKDVEEELITLDRSEVIDPWDEVPVGGKQL